VVKSVLNLINKCPSAARRDPMIHRAADLLQISPQALGQDLRREQRNQRPAPRRTEDPVPKVAPPKTYPKDEISLLELLVHYYHEVQPLVHDYLPAGCITNPICRELVELLMVDLPEALTEGFHDFDEETQRAISRIQVEESRQIDEETSPVVLTQYYILLFWKRRVDSELRDLNHRTDLSNKDRYIERSQLAQIKKGLENNSWAESKLAIETHLHSEG
jgi:DNA primase